jgi:hypothetical protein
MTAQLHAFASIVASLSRLDSPFAENRYRWLLLSLLARELATAGLSDSVNRESGSRADRERRGMWKTSSQIRGAG